MSVVADSRARAHAVGAEELRARLQPPVRMTVSEWADRYRMLSPESSPEPGPWRTSRAPYLREIMNTLGDPLVRKVVWASASQVGKTEVVMNYLGSRIHKDPGPTMVVQPTLKKAQGWSKTRLAPMLRDSKALRGKVADARTRDSGNTTLQKTYPGGLLRIVGANSAADLSSDPIRDFLGDEIDRYPASAGTEGDPLSLGIQRTRNFWNRKVLLVSSPGDLETSRIWPEWLASDRRRYFVPCPHCSERRVLIWKNVKWESDEIDGDHVHRPETACYVCESCGSIIDETSKRRMLELGEWCATNPDGRFPGFHLSALYSPWVTWAELAALWLEKKRSPEELKTFINLQLGEPWEERDQAFEPTDLASRAEKYPEEIPHGVGVLTAFVDVQADRLELSIRGWGEREESWLIGHHRIYGDPEQDELWSELEHHLARAYVHESGAKLRIRVAMIDSGYLPHRVHRFVRGRELRGVYSAKGSDSRLRETLSRATRKNRDQVKPWTVDSHHFKAILFRRLCLTAGSAEPGGPGYMHFCVPTRTGADAEYFAQFAAEQLRLVRQGRRFRKVFKQVRARNESIDLEAGNIAALYTMGDGVVKRLGEMAHRVSEGRSAGLAVPRGRRIRSRGVER